MLGVIYTQSSRITVKKKRENPHISPLQSSVKGKLFICKEEDVTEI
jgi:hypothetical protein